MKSWTRRLRSPWLVLLGVLAFGCSRLPTAPELAQKSVDTKAGTVVIVEPRDPGDGSGGGDPAPIPAEPDTLVRAEDIDGSEGGEVKVGYVEVEVPVGAFEGEAEIRITIPDEDSLMCHLDIYPESKNDFERPVTVTFDVRHVNPADLGIGPTQTMGVFWFDEQHHRWVQIPATLDEERGEIRAELSHFSQYKVAKASWNKASW